jgi:uncharacterized zinc-type alcohol dehydrogenase-like protein
MLENAWGISAYPFVPGHEVSGRVAAAGERVSNVKVGDRVGLGWHAGYCMTCEQCLGGHHNMCATAEQTIVGRHGGFADLVARPISPASMIGNTRSAQSSHNKPISKL